MRREPADPDERFILRFILVGEVIVLLEIINLMPFTGIFNGVSLPVIVIAVIFTFFFIMLSLGLLGGFALIIWKKMRQVGTTTND